MYNFTDEDIEYLRHKAFRKSEHPKDCKCGYCTLEEVKNNIKITQLKAQIFVKHIEKHLEEMPEVLDKRPHCKICGKDIDTIFEEEQRR